MKKLMVLFTALMFLATFSLIGCNQSQPPAKPAAEKGAKGAPGRLEPPEPPERLERLEHLRQKKNRRGIPGYSLAKRLYPLIFTQNGESTLRIPGRQG